MKKKSQYKPIFFSQELPKLPNESNWEWCQRYVDHYDPSVIIRDLLIYIDQDRRRGDLTPLWSKVGCATGNGSGVASAIVNKYLPEAQDDN